APGAVHCNRRAGGAACRRCAVAPPGAARRHLASHAAAGAPAQRSIAYGGQDMRLVSIIAAALLGPGVAAVAADWQVLPAQSELRFVGSPQGEDFEGRFQRFDARIQFDPSDPASPRFAVGIDLASADSANSERDETLLGP